MSLPWPRVCHNPIANRTERALTLWTMHTASFARLSNGLRLVTVHRPHLHRVVITAYIHVGSRHETRGTNGISHFLEHMLFRGTKRRPTASEFNHGIESLGGTLTAATHGDFTRFELTVPPDALAAGCVELGEVFTSAVFSDRDVEKGIVREEILEDLDEDGRDVNADNLCRARVFNHHPLGFPITGTARNLERFNERHLRAHLERHYVARNMVVSVTGPLPHRAMLRAIERGFADLTPGAPTPASVFRTRQQRARVHEASNAGSQTTVRIAFPTPGQRSPHARALELLMRVLDDGMSTRLHRRICDERGLAYEVSAGIELFDDAGVMDVASCVAHSSLPSLVGEVLSILADLSVEGPTRAEVEKAHRRYAFDLDVLEDDAHALGDFYGAAELFDLRQTPGERRRQILALTAQDLRRAARLIFNPSRLNLVLVGTLDDAIRAEVRGLVRKFRRRVTERPKVTVSAASRSPSRVAPPVRRPRSILDLGSTSP